MMKLYNNPPEALWAQLCQRPVLASEALQDRVQGILDAVKQDGDLALERFSRQYDGIWAEELYVTDTELEAGVAQISPALQEAIALAARNIRAFHETQCRPEPMVETMPGVRCWRRSVPIERVGLYIPGGSAPLFSTILMLGIPAQLAGCADILLCTPCDAQGKIDPAILFTARLLGIRKICKIGGAQAIAAMAYGTGLVPKVDKLFGPGNQYVTKAKALVQQEGIAIDIPAGPSEVLIIAGGDTDPEFVAADLLAQAEHGPDSQVVLLSDDTGLIAAVNAALEQQLRVLPRRETATSALHASFAICFPTLEDCIRFSNCYAPEHLILALEDALSYSNSIQHAGSVFLGPYSCESAGDYASGTNHTLPTNGLARSYSGVSVDSFVRKISFQEISAAGLCGLGPAIELMAAAEQLEAHKNAVSIRLNKLKR
jgi:histidinol dehydrogenase